MPPVLLCHQSGRTKKTPNNPFFSSQNLWILCAQCAKKERSGLEWHWTGSNVYDNAGVYVATLQVQLSHCCGCNPLEQLYKHPTVVGSRKIRRPVRDLLWEKIANKKCLPFRRNTCLKTREKSQTIFSDFWSWSICRVSFSKSHTMWRFFSLTAVSVELVMLPECDPSLSTKCALAKSSQTLQRVLVVLAWQGALHETTLKKSKTFHDEVRHRAWSKYYCWGFHDRLWEALSGTTSEKKRPPQPYWGWENSGNALEPTNALNDRVWGIPDVLLRGKPWEQLRGLSGISSRISSVCPSRRGGVAYLVKAFRAYRVVA